MIERGIALARRRGDRVWELALTTNLVSSYFIDRPLGGGRARHRRDAGGRTSLRRSRPGGDDARRGRDGAPSRRARAHPRAGGRVRGLGGDRVHRCGRRPRSGPACSLRRRTADTLTRHPSARTPFETSNRHDDPEAVEGSPRAAAASRPRTTAMPRHSRSSSSSQRPHRRAVPVVQAQGAVAACPTRRTARRGRATVRRGRHRAARCRSAVLDRHRLCSSRPRGSTNTDGRTRRRLCSSRHARCSSASGHGRAWSGWTRFRRRARRPRRRARRSAEGGPA